MTSTLTPTPTSNNTNNPSHWIEIFHSKPSLRHCYLLEKLADGQFTLPCDQNRLSPADDVRPAFRVLRLAARPLDYFVLADGPVGATRGVLVDDNYGKGYSLSGDPGRYVVENGIRRVGDADARACAQAVLRFTDRYIHLAFRADLWARCYASFLRPGDSEWTPAPGELMTRVERPADKSLYTNNFDKANGHHHQHEQQRRFELIIEAKALTVAFTDGNGTWDSNGAKNYHIGLPGKYMIADGAAMYLGPSDKDLELYPKGSPRPDAVKPPPLPKPTPAVTIDRPDPFVPAAI